MANITLDSAVALSAGTTGDDILTLDAALNTATDGDIAHNGNGGSDTLVLTETLAEVIGYATTSAGDPIDSLSYDGGNTTWTLDEAPGSANAMTASNGFSAVQFADGTVLQAGVASSGNILTDISTGSLDLTTIQTYNWNGFALTDDTLTVGSIVSVDGQVIDTVGDSFTNDDGAFEITGGNTVVFTPNSTAIAAQGNPGQTASFSYDVVVDDGDGNLSTITLTFTADIEFTAGNDTWNADEAGTNTVDETSGEDEGDDTFNGNDEVDNITAGAGNDSIFGGNGNDVLEGGAGDDMIRGGNGHDTITVGTGVGAETDSNNLGGGAGDDKITGGDGADVIFGGQGDDSNTANNGSDGGLFGGAGEDTINGGAGNDYLDGGADNDELRGGDGDDEIYGDTGDDVLRGGAGTDILSGEGGNDTLYMSLGGDNGDDQLTGGADDDTFVLKTNAGDATITDFTTGEDVLDVTDLGITDLAGIQAIAYEVGGDVIIQIDADTEVTLTTHSLASLTEDDFTFAS
jgi:Ca2+-binding RTX toxin-like protein